MRAKEFKINDTSASSTPQPKHWRIQLQAFGGLCSSRCRLCRGRCQISDSRRILISSCGVACLFFLLKQPCK